MNTEDAPLSEEHGYLRVSEACEYLDIKANMIYRAVAKDWLRATKPDKEWLFTRPDLDEYRRTHLEKSGPPARITTLLQSQQEPSWLPPAALQSLDPLEEVEPADIIEEELRQHDEAIENEVSAAIAELTPEELMLKVIMARLRRQVAKAQQGKTEKLLGTLYALRESIDNIIAVYEADKDDTLYP